MFNQGTIYRGKIGIKNPWVCVDPQSPPLNDAPESSKVHS